MTLALFVVDCAVGGITAERLTEFRRLLRDAADRVSQRGEAVRYLRCTFIPEQSRCICLFEARDLGTVRLVTEIAQFPFGQIGLAVEFYGIG